MKFTINFTQEELEIIDLALQSLPFGRVHALYFNLKNQVEEQIKEEQMLELAKQAHVYSAVPTSKEHENIISAD